MPGRSHQFDVAARDAGGKAVVSTYEARLMSAWNQHQVLRRIMPLVAARVGAVMGRGRVISAEATAQMVAALADLSEADHDWVLGQLLGCVQRRDATGGWGRVWLTGQHTSMFDDLNYDLAALYAVLKEVVEFTYGPFFALVMSYLPAPGDGDQTTTQ